VRVGATEPAPGSSVTATVALPEAGALSVSAGVAELMPFDDAAALLGRADAALALALAKAPAGTRWSPPAAGRNRRPPYPETGVSFSARVGRKLDSVTTPISGSLSFWHTSRFSAPRCLRSDQSA
jgi:hypothetical protein